MNKLLPISIICFALAGCTGGSHDFHAVWTQRTSPPTDLPPPSGFNVTPAQAVLAARESGALSLKHVWHVYADPDHYYVHDIFLGDGPRRAFAYGVRIDGRTGEIDWRRQDPDTRD